MWLSVGAHHMRDTGFDVAERAVLHPYQVTVTHQYHLLAIDADDTVHDIARAVDPRQHDIAHLCAVGTS
jgi:hypothetical protein